MNNQKENIGSYIIKKLVESICTEIDFLIQKDITKDKMLYSLCLNDDEKNDVTKNEIKKMQLKLAKCKPEVMEFAQTFLTHDFFSEMDGYTNDEAREVIVKNFILNEQEYVIEILKIYHKEKGLYEVDDIDFWHNTVLAGEFGLDKKLVKHFIKVFAMVDRLRGYKCILNQSNLEPESKPTSETSYTYQELIPPEKQEYIQKLLEYLSITVNGKSILTQRKKGALRGVIEALKEKCIIPNIGLHTLCSLFASQIELELKSELDASTTSEKYKKDAFEYIKDNPFLSI